MFLELPTIDPVVLLVTYITGGITLTAGAIKGIHDIKKDGWEAFRDRWITPRRARRKREQEEREQDRKQRASIVETVNLMSAQVNEVFKEVKPNGGDSLKDRIVNLDAKVENLVARDRHRDETNDVPTFTLDEEFNLVFANSAFRELVNTEESDLLYRKYLSRVDDDDRVRLIRVLNEAIDNKIPLDLVVNFKTHTMGLVKVRLQATPDVRHGGMLKGFFGTASEVKDGNA